MFFVFGMDGINLKCTVCSEGIQAPRWWKEKHPTDWENEYNFTLCWNTMVFKWALFTLRLDCNKLWALYTWGCDVDSYSPSQNTYSSRLPPLHQFRRKGKGHVRFGLHHFWRRGTHSYSSALLVELLLPLTGTASHLMAMQAWKPGLGRMMSLLPCVSVLFWPPQLITEESVVGL